MLATSNNAKRAPKDATMTNRSETFGRLLKAGISSIANCEGKIAPIIEEELGQQIGRSGHAIQRYKAGHLPPEDRTVAILAEAAIRRGYLNRDWLQRFLHAARYPFADTLLDRLCPLGSARPRPPRVYHNLPAPTYSQFVMREQAFAEVIDGLQQRSAVVLIVGLGGNGKTSLAREVVARCLQDDGDAPRFDAAVWVSDKDRPGTTNLSVVLDEIARTLDYPGFAQFAHDEKLYEVSQLLKRQRVLVVVDNFETITDGALLAWLLRLPEPSKALITSREYSRAFRNSTIVVDLRGMSEAEAQEFIGQRLRVLRIERLVSDHSQLEPLVVATGGNPKAIEIALGLVKHERRPLQQVVDDLYAARGELFDDLFTRAWALLDEAAWRVLLVMTFFPASASSEALSAAADVQGFAFDRAVERLTDLALLDVQQVDLNSLPRYTLHPLVRSFAGARLVEQPAFEDGARERWVGWYVQLASKVGFCWDDLSKLLLLDNEYETAYAVALWTLENERYIESHRVGTGITYFFYVRGIWDKSLSINLIRSQAAQYLSDIRGEIKAIANCVQMLVVQGSIKEAETYLLKLHELGQSSQLSPDTFYAYQHALYFFWAAYGDLDKAQQACQEVLRSTEGMSKNLDIANCHALATVWYRMGKLKEVEQILLETLEKAIQYNYQRAVVFITIRLVAIDLDQGNPEGAAKKLSEIRLKAYEHQDRRYIAEIQRLYARLHTLRGDLPAARAALAEAIDLFERLGMRRELAEAREALADL